MSGLSAESVRSPEVFPGVRATWELEVCPESPSVPEGAEASKFDAYGLQL